MLCRRSLLAFLGFAAAFLVLAYAVSAPAALGQSVAFTAPGYVTSESGSAALVIQRSGGTSGSVTIGYKTTAGTAADGLDYTGTQSGSVTMADGQTQTTILVPVANDTLDEDDEIFTVTLANATDGTTIGTPSTATVTIADNDAPPTVSAWADFSFKEGSEGQRFVGNLPRADLSAPSGKTVTVQYTTADDTAIAGSDYTATSGSLTFAPGETVKRFNIGFNGDTAIEPDETFLVNFSNPTNATLGDSQQRFTLLDDDQTHYFLSSSTYSGEEGTGIVLTVDRAGQTPAETVYWYTYNYSSSGSPYAGSADYTGSTGTTSDAVSFAAGETSKTFTIQTTEDSAFEGDETFAAGVQSNAGGRGSTIAPSQATVTIQDDEAPPTDLTVMKTDHIDPAGRGQQLHYKITVTNSSSTAAENVIVVDNMPASFTTSHYNIAADWRWSCTVNGSTWTCRLPSLAANSSSSVTLVVIPQSNGSFVNNVSVSTTTPESNTGNNSHAEPTNVDDPGTLRLSSATYSHSESEENATVTVRRENGTGGYVSAILTFSDGTAQMGPDYGYSGSSRYGVTFAPGQVEKTFQIRLLNDGIDEDDETFNAQLSEPSNGATLGSPSAAVVTIQDDDPPPTISINDVSKAEGQTGTTDFTFRITRAAPSGRTTSGAWATAPGTAAPGSDYVHASGTFSLPAGSTSTEVTVEVNGDTLAENNETFSVVLSSLVNATIAGSDLTGQGTIQNDDLYDLKVTKTAPPGPVARGQDLPYAIAVENLSTGVAAPNVVLTDVIAPGSDFRGQMGGCSSFTYNPGTRTATCRLGTIAPGDVKDVTIVVRPNQTGLLQNTAAATADGVDGDSTNNSSTIQRSVQEPGSFRFSSATYESSEGAVMATVTVQRMGGFGGRATVQYASSDGTATAGSDYTATSGTLTFEPGETTPRTFTVSLLEDALDEADESIELALSNPTGGTTLSSPASAALTIRDNDLDPTLSVGDVSAAEGNSGTTAFTFTATLSTASGRAVTGTYVTEDGSAVAGLLDYQAASGSFSIPAGSTSTTVTVQVNGDILPEASETFLLKLTETSTTLASSGNDLTGQGTIQNDDLADIKLAKSLSAGTPNPAPTGAPLTFVLALRNLSASPAVDVNVIDTLPAGTTFASASDGCSYDSTTHTVTCSYGTVAGGAEAGKSIVIIPTTAGLKINAALAASTSPETDTTNNASQAAVDVQAPGAFRFSSSAYAVEEGASRVITVERTGGAGGTAAVDYTATPGSAQANDFTDNDGTLTFGPGETSKTFTVVTQEDGVDELDETVGLSLANPTGGASLGGPSSAALTIEDDDATPTLSVADMSKDEGHSVTSPLTFTVKLTGLSDRPVTVAYATEDGTATAPGDYASASGSLTFAPGETEKAVAVQIVGDRALEPDETLVLRLSGAQNAAVADGEATGTIKNDDGAGADLTLTKTGPAEALLLSEFDYKLKVTNKGPDTASSVGIQDVLPLEVRIVSLSTTQGACSGTEAVSCALGTLAVGQSAEVTIRVRAVVTGPARNSATVAAGQHDPTPGDNTAAATTVIKTQPGVPREPSMALPCKITVTTDYIFRGLVTFVGVSVTRDGVPLDGVKVYSKHSWHPKITNTKTNRFGYTEYHFLTRTPGGTVEFVADCDRNGLRPASVKNLRTYGAGKSAHAQEPADISYTTGLQETTDLSRVTPFVGSGQRMPLRSPAAKANCQSVRVSSANLRAGKRGTVTVQVLFAGRPVKTAAVVLDGAAGRQIKATGLSGRVAFTVQPVKRGSIQVRVPNFAACSSVATLAVAP